ncbi:MAG: helix-hairpin-helix domain-containing protein [Deltaproteobacteria bacterium]|jgi:transcriptional accessory protein Tex/SPT6|nr:helix-hairpin-helix domain-containing protein [Deltaproteobacteria bacterium]
MADVAERNLRQAVSKLKISKKQFIDTLNLLKIGLSIPFIARYRQEETGGLDEQTIFLIREANRRFEQLNQRADRMLTFIEEKGLLTPELEEEFMRAEGIYRLEDLFLPYRSLQCCLAKKARAEGLEPLALRILEQDPLAEPLEMALEAIDAGAKVDNLEDALIGAGHIMSEIMFFDDLALAEIRKIFRSGFVLAFDAHKDGDPAKKDGTAGQTAGTAGQTAGATGQKAGEPGQKAGEPGQKAGEPAQKAGEPGKKAGEPGKKAGEPAQKVGELDKQALGEEQPRFGDRVEKLLASRYFGLMADQARGDVILKYKCDEPAAFALLRKMFIKGESPSKELVERSIHDAFHYLFTPNAIKQTERFMRHRALPDASRVLAKNVKELLRTPPLRNRNVLALNPNPTYGTRIVALDKDGNLLEWANLNIHGGFGERGKAKQVILEFLERYDIKAVAVSATTTCKEASKFLRSIDGFPVTMPVMLIRPSGLASYALSYEANREFPHLDQMVRGCVSIGRRLLDPLSEFSKIDLTSIFMVANQFELDRKYAARFVEDVAVSAVCENGVDLNKATASVLQYIPGLNSSLGEEIVRHRSYYGPFRNRLQLLEVSEIDSSAYKRCSCYLLIPDGDNPLDRTLIHPEAYPVVERMAKDLGITTAELVGKGKLLKALNLKKYQTEELGMPTINTIVAELSKKHIDNRKSYSTLTDEELYVPSKFTVEELKPGMVLSGRVANFLSYGAFIDVGYHTHALLHVSEMSRNFVKHPGDLLGVNQRVRCFVKRVIPETGQIELTLKNANGVFENEESHYTGEYLNATAAETAAEDNDSTSALMASILTEEHERPNSRLGTLFSGEQLEALREMVTKNAPLRAMRGTASKESPEGGEEAPAQAEGGEPPAQAAGDDPNPPVPTPPAPTPPVPSPQRATPQATGS